MSPVLPAPAATLRRRFHHWRGLSPAPWARFGVASAWMARLRPPQAPPLLLLSLPRSGSSWIGATLGQADNALYLREPLTQAHLAAGGRSATPRVAPASLPAGYFAASELAFAAIPRFRENHVTPFAGQWAWRNRSKRRLLIKEVNPHAADWLLTRYRPRLIFLTRHPAAIALSYRQQGWWRDEANVWGSVGRRFAGALADAWQVIQAYDDCRIISYETLCLDPVKEFQALFHFAGLTWGEQIQATVVRQSSGGNGQLTRYSRVQAFRWRQQIEPVELAELAAAYRPFDLPWYRDDTDWLL